MKTKKIRLFESSKFSISPDLLKIFSNCSDVVFCLNGLESKHFIEKLLNFLGSQDNQVSECSLKLLADISLLPFAQHVLLDSNLEPLFQILKIEERKSHRQICLKIFMNIIKLDKENSVFGNHLEILHSNLRQLILESTDELLLRDHVTLLSLISQRPDSKKLLITDIPLLYHLSSLFISDDPVTSNRASISLCHIFSQLEHLEGKLIPEHQKLIDHLIKEFMKTQTFINLDDQILKNELSKKYIQVFSSITWTKVSFLKDQTKILIETFSKLILSDSIDSMTLIHSLRVYSSLIGSFFFFFFFILIFFFFFLIEFFF